LSVSFCSRNDCVDSRDTEQSECWLDIWFNNWRCSRWEKIPKMWRTTPHDSLKILKYQPLASLSH
jgi:hypothetical protein